MATDMMQAGVPLDVIAMQGGWQNPNTLPLVYGAEGRQARGLSVIREFNAARKRAR